MTLLFRICFFAVLLLISWLAFTPSPPPATGLSWDKANHAFAFLILAFLADFSFRQFPWLNWIGLAGYGVAIECVQWLLEFRFFELNDIVADLIGIVLYVLVRPLINRITFLSRLRIED